jgi:hypothetical protein
LQVGQTDSIRKSTNDFKKKTLIHQDSMGDVIEEMAKNVVAMNSGQQATDPGKFSEKCKKSSLQRQDPGHSIPSDSQVKGQPRISHGSSRAKVPRQ